MYTSIALNFTFTLTDSCMLVYMVAIFYYNLLLDLKLVRNMY